MAPYWHGSNTQLLLHYYEANGFHHIPEVPYSSGPPEWITIFTRIIWFWTIDSLRLESCLSQDNSPNALLLCSKKKCLWKVSLQRGKCQARRQKRSLNLPIKRKLHSTDNSKGPVWSMDLSGQVIPAHLHNMRPKALQGSPVFASKRVWALFPTTKDPRTARKWICDPVINKPGESSMSARWSTGWCCSCYVMWKLLIKFYSGFMFIVFRQ